MWSNCSITVVSQILVSTHSLFVEEYFVNPSVIQETEHKRAQYQLKPFHDKDVGLLIKRRHQRRWKDKLKWYFCESRSCAVPACSEVLFETIVVELKIERQQRIGQSFKLKRWGLEGCVLWNRRRKLPTFRIHHVMLCCEVATWSMTQSNLIIELWIRDGTVLIF